MMIHRSSPHKPPESACPASCILMYPPRPASCILLYPHIPSQPASCILLYPHVPSQPPVSSCILLYPASLLYPPVSSCTLYPPSLSHARVAPLFFLRRQRAAVVWTCWAVWRRCSWTARCVSSRCAARPCAKHCTSTQPASTTWSSGTVRGTCVCRACGAVPCMCVHAYVRECSVVPWDAVHFSFCTLKFVAS